MSLRNTISPKKPQKQTLPTFNDLCKIPMGKVCIGSVVSQSRKSGWGLTSFSNCFSKSLSHFTNKWQFCNINHWPRATAVSSNCKATWETKDTMVNTDSLKIYLLSNFLDSFWHIVFKMTIKTINFLLNHNMTYCITVDFGTIVLKCKSWENQPELPSDKGSNRSRDATCDIGRGPMSTNIIS